MSNDDDSASRKTFEAWYIGEFYRNLRPRDIFNRNPCGSYVWSHIQEGWVFWQASRTAALAERDRVMEEAEQALEEAELALPILETMLKTVGLKAGADVASAMIKNTAAALAAIRAGRKGEG